MTIEEKIKRLEARAVLKKSDMELNYAARKQVREDLKKLELHGQELVEEYADVKGELAELLRQQKNAKQK